MMTEPTNIPDLTFDPDVHEYYFRGVLVPSVTQVLKMVTANREYSLESSERGSVVHGACSLLMRRALNWDAVDPRFVGYVRSFEKWFTTRYEDYFKSECAVWSPQYRFAGTCDIHNDDYVYDIKSGVGSPSHAYQTAAYDLALGGKARKRFAIYLDKDGGRPRIAKHEGRSDRAIFLSALTVHNIRKRDHID